jgi:hypothetical protein
MPDFTASNQGGREKAFHQNTNLKIGVRGQESPSQESPSQEGKIFIHLL